MVGVATVGKGALKSEINVAQAEAPELEKVVWYTDPGLRKLYAWATVLCIASATTGYDGYGHVPCTMTNCPLIFIIQNDA